MGSSRARPRAETFPKSARVRCRSEFLALGRSGGRMPTRHFLLVHQHAPADGLAAPARLGITVTRKIGCAVVRNRIKRAVRETFRRSRHTLPDGLSIIVIARNGAGDLGGAAIAQEIEPALHEVSARRAGRGAASSAERKPS